MEWSFIAWHQILEKSIVPPLGCLFSELNIFFPQNWVSSFFQAVLLHAYSCLNDIELDHSAFHKQKGSLCPLDSKEECHFPLHQKKDGSPEWNSSVEKQSQSILLQLFSSHKCECKDSLLYCSAPYVAYPRYLVWKLLIWSLVFLNVLLAIHGFRMINLFV